MTWGGSETTVGLQTRNYEIEYLAPWKCIRLAEQVERRQAPIQPA